MTDQDRVRLLAKLRELTLAFPHREIPEETILLYAHRLSTLPVDAVCAGIDRLIDTATFFPTIAEIKEAAIAGPIGPDVADEAWAEVVREARRVGYNRLPVFRDGRLLPPPTPAFSSPLIAAAVNAVGWELICNGDNSQGHIRNAFLRTFRSLQERELRAKQTGALPVTAALSSEVEP